MRKQTALSLAFLFFIGGCVTPSKTTTLIRTEPPGAEVAIGNTVIGKTPITYDLDQESGSGKISGSGLNQLSIKFHLEGYKDEVQTVQKVKGSFGDLNRQWPKEVNVELEKKK